MNCHLCGKPLPISHFPGAIPEHQAVFTVRDGQRIHAGGCPAPMNPPSVNEGD